MEVCPTEVIHAPVQQVWDLLTVPRSVAQWSGVALKDGPERPVRPGDCFALGRLGLRIRFQVLETNPPHQLDAYVRLPFGVVNHERTVLTALGPAVCRVTLN